MFSSRRGEMKPLAELISLKGKLAMITGSASGIGKAMAHRFAEAGASLELVDVDEERLKTVKSDLQRFKVEVNIHRVDLSEKSQIDELWKKLEGREPDILVNNAGIYPFKEFLEVDEKLLTHVTETNLNSVFWMCQNMIRMREKKGGTIVNVASIEAILPFKKDLTHYSLTKSGVIAITRGLAKDYGKLFKINAVIPGGIVTPGTKKIAKEALKMNFGIIKSGREFKSRLPCCRFGDPDEVALMTLVLASDLSSYVNGALIPVDGGFLSA